MRVDLRIADIVYGIGVERTLGDVRGRNTVAGMKIGQYIGGAG